MIIFQLFSSFYYLSFISIYIQWAKLTPLNFLLGSNLQMTSISILMVYLAKELLEKSLEAIPPKDNVLLLSRPCKERDMKDKLRPWRLFLHLSIRTSWDTMVSKRITIVFTFSFNFVPMEHSQISLRKVLRKQMSWNYSDNSLKECVTWTLKVYLPIHRKNAQRSQTR